MQLLGHHAALQVFLIVPRNVWVQFTDAVCTQPRRPRPYAGVQQVLPHVGATIKAQIVLEPRPELHHPALHMQEVAFPVDGAAPRVVPRGDPGRLRLHHVRIPIQRAEQADVVVHAVHPIGVIRATRLHAGIGAAEIHALHGEHADITAGAPEVLPEAKHARVGAWIQIIATLGDGEQPQPGGFGQLAGEPHTAIDRDLQARGAEADTP